LDALGLDNTLSGIFVKVDVETSVSLLELFDGEVAESLPESESFAVA
jgi:hypothetical protein